MANVQLRTKQSVTINPLIQLKMKTLANAQPKNNIAHNRSLPLSLLVAGATMIAFPALADSDAMVGQMQQPHPFIVVASLIVSAIGLTHAFGPYVKREMARRESLRREREWAAANSSSNTTLYSIPDIALPSLPKHELHPDNTEFFRRQQMQASQAD